MKTLYLVRHAQSAPHPEIPDPEWPLSARGQAQAQRLVELLGALGIEEVHSSPYQRCRDTIAPFVAAARTPLHEHHDLRERRISMTYILDFPPVWQRSWDDFAYALPDGESSQVAQQRVHAAVMAICAASAARTLLINSHGNALSLLLHRADPTFGIARASAMRNPDVFRMTYRDGELTWDASWQHPLLDEFASHPRETHFPRVIDNGGAKPEPDS